MAIRHIMGHENLEITGTSCQKYGDNITWALLFECCTVLAAREMKKAINVLDLSECIEIA